MTSITKLVLVGFPNTGKTTLFNYLNGTSYKIGNWSGVTVREHKAAFSVCHKKYELIDVPGILSVYDVVDQEDCLVCRQAIEKADVLINVMDGRHIHRDLVLTLQLMCYEKPLFVIITYEEQMKIEPEKLKALLPVPCLFSQNVSLQDLVELGESVEIADIYNIIEWPIGFSLERGKGMLAEQLKKKLVGDDEADVLIAEGFYQTAAVLIDRYGCREPNLHKENGLDRWLLHPFLGVIAFFMIVYAMFSITIGLGGALGDLLSGLVVLFLNTLPQNYIYQILLYSAGVGVATCIGFLPILGVMYLFIGYLEQSGYLSRIVLLADALMRPIGLSGHSFIPLMLGFGCNIPAVMATRVISGENNRVLTALMVPFMSCSARLTIFAIFAAAFFPNRGALVIMGLYLLSLLLGIMTVLMLQYIFQFKGSSSLSIALPSYQWPNSKEILSSTKLKLKGFIRENFMMIVIFSGILGTIGHMNGSFEVVQTQYSILAKWGMYTTRWLSFMGIAEDNWPATVALFSGVVAKEVVIATLNSLYQVSQVPSESVLLEMYGLLMEFGERLLYFPLQFLFLDWGEIKIHQLYQAYFSTRSALAYMVFILLYFPCLSTMVVLRNEFSLWIAGFSFIWTTFLAIWFAKMTYWGIGGLDVLCLFSIFVIMRGVRYYNDTLKA